MKHLDLFSGDGGFALAAQWMNWQTVAFVEKNKRCQKVLSKRFTGVPIYGDIKEFNQPELRGAIDIVTGGDPCQPHSVAGLGKGTKDVRFLWPEMFRIARQLNIPWEPVDLWPADTNVDFERRKECNYSSITDVLTQGVSGYFGFGPSPHGHITRDILESGIVGMLNGLSTGMDYSDRNQRIQEMGNAIVPGVAYEIFKAISGVC